MFLDIGLRAKCVHGEIFQVAMYSNEYFPEKLKIIQLADLIQIRWLVYFQISWLFCFKEVHNNVQVCTVDTIIKNLRCVQNHFRGVPRRAAESGASVCGMQKLVAATLQPYVFLSSWTFIQSFVHIKVLNCFVWEHSFFKTK